MEKLIGRIQECDELTRALHSNRSEFVVLYGRRRVGKTFLIRSYFHDEYDFHYVGAHKAKSAIQLQNFRKALVRYSGTEEIPSLADWSMAFEQLEKYLESLPSSKRKVLFWDEMPWIDNKQSDFVAALEYFWNSWVSSRDDIVFIACGSATSWMADKLLENQGGLHNRITRQIYLRPFSLHECQEYLKQRDFDWDHYQVIQCYMVFGGVPFYWSLLENSLSLSQNIDQLCFRRSGLLHGELDELYYALFSNADRYLAIVRALAGRQDGMTRDELEKTTSIQGGTLTKLLRNLERCDFISSFGQFGNKSKCALYRLCDFFTLFYLRFLDGERSYDEDFWAHHSTGRNVVAWEGLTFELVCLQHLSQIKKGLGISGMETKVSAWRYIPNKQKTTRELPAEGAQIDLVIARADKMIHLCDIKFSEGQYAISKEYETHLKQRMEIFRQVTGTTHSLRQTFISPHGIVKGLHSSFVHSEITAKDLFTE